MKRHSNRFEHLDTAQDSWHRCHVTQ